MIEIFDGKYCGVCHGKVAFPNLDCQRCHSQPV
jgi:c(7)-type cytochrome triheme protein